MRSVPPFVPTADDLERADVELQTIVPESRTRPYDMREVVSRILDGREFFEVQPFFARTSWSALGRPRRPVVGIVGNHRVLAGAIDINASVKAARFIRSATHSGIPDHLLRRCAGISARARPGARRLIRTGRSCSMRTPRRPSQLTVITRKDYGGRVLRHVAQGRWAPT